MEKPNISEDDLIRIFSHPKRKEKRSEVIFNILNRVLTFLIIICAVYVLINIRAFTGKFLFWYKTDYKAEPYIDQSIGQNLESASKEKENNQQVVVKEPEKPKIVLPEMTENEIKIPSLNIIAPISWRVNNVPSEVSKALENGVIQISGTSLPGEQGNVYITGHSSNYVWAKGNYGNIFATINNLSAGEQVYIKFNNTTYVYKVTDQKTVFPTDLSIMNTTEDSRLTLVTCWPVGTSLKRLVVLATQVYPDPSTNKKPAATPDFTKLPGAR